MNLALKYKSLLDSYEINTPLRLAYFFAQIEHESNLKPVSENLNYSIKGLLTTFPKYFTPTTAPLYAKKPYQIGSKVYANRMGNGNYESGDGYNYRGRGFIQITGKDNYKQLSKDTGIDFVNNADLLLVEPNAMLSALWYWKRNNLNRYSDADDIIGSTKRINGAFIGLKHRKQCLVKWKKILGTTV